MNLNSLQPRISDVHQISILWPSLSSSNQSLEQYSRFFEYIATEINLTSTFTGISSKRAYSLVFGAVAVLRRHGNSPRSILLKEIASLCKETEDVEEKTMVWQVIQAALHIWLALDIQLDDNLHGVTFAETISGKSNAVVWEGETSLQTLTEQEFLPESSNATNTGQSFKVEPIFTMAYLVNYYGFRIYWTSSLTEHLTINWKFKTVSIFQHKICLWNHTKYPDTSPIPLEIHEEALDTMNLLFPFDDTSTKALLQKEGVNFYSLGFCGRERLLDLDRYNYWRLPLEELVGVLQLPPSGLHQLRLDKDGRNLLQFATFWIAAAVALLTIVSFIFGILSTIYAKRGYDIAVLQYKLSLAQACAEPGAKEQLPDFC